MNFSKSNLQDVFLLEPTVYEDSRGFFMESFNKKEFNKIIGRDVDFVQDNHSKSGKGVLRGLHYQAECPQGKLVRVLSGKILDIVLDLRVNSTTFKQWELFELSSDCKKQVWIPEGFAHGFLTLTDDVEILYKTTNYYNPNYEVSIAWDDPEIGIKLPIDLNELILSEKDSNGLLFKDAKLFS